ncbi:MAG: glycosyl hydrolase, partial [Acidobacteria bacterium]|nr:glycosyl hydrolase [Acidobacteriota bacterium]
GSTWKHLTGSGLPDGILGRIGISVSGGDSNRVYALIEAQKGGLYRSDDAGESWTLVNDDGRFRQRAWYFTHVFADPKSPDTLYILNTGLYKSTDAGRTFNLLPAPHGDHHGLWIDPTNPQRLINGNDGGATISTDGGKTWTSQLNQPTAQFYHVMTDNNWPYYIYGAQQDNSTVGIASFDDEGVITMRDWYSVGGGESGYIAPDPRDHNIVYAGSDSASITRYNHANEQLRDISVWPEDTSGEGAEKLKYRFQWTAPVMLSPNDPNVIYTSAQFVFESTDQGQSWKTISPDLTRNDKTRQLPSGGPLTKDITSVEYYDTVFALAESPKKRGLLWAGTDDGLVHVTQDDGSHWSNVTPKAMPEWSMVSIIEASPFDENTAYVAVDRHKLDDFKPYIFKTTDLGKSWTQLTSGIPEGAYVHSVREDPKRKGLLYAGTETGVYVSFNDGQRWQPLQLNLPTTPIHDLVIKNDDLVIATHGRAFWVLDDITPLRQLTSELASQDMILYQPEEAVRLHYPEQVDTRRPVGQNPPPGAILNYYFASEPKGEVKLEVFDANGKLIRSLSSIEKKVEGEQPPEWPDMIQPATTIPAKAGMNRFAWDLRYTSPVKIPNSFYSSSGPIGPLVLPGTYQVKLTANGKTLSAPLEIKLDPRVHISEDDLRKQSDLDMKVYESNNQLHTAVNQIRDMHADLDRLQKRFAEDVRLRPVVGAAGDLAKKITHVEEGLIQVNMKGSEANLAFPNQLNEKFDTFIRSVESADAPPTKQQYEVFDYLNGQLQTLLANWKQVQDNDVRSFNALVEKYQVPFLPGSGNSGAVAAGGQQ